MPYYCTVPRCTSMAGKAKNVSFHQFPRDEELAKLWNDILKRGKPYTKYSKVCSLHFRPEDYTITSVGKNKGQWRTLRKDAVPSQNLPSESPIPSAHPKSRGSGSWVPNNAPPSILDPRMQHHMAQAIYVQTMLAMQAATNGSHLPPMDTANSPQSNSATTLSISDIEQIIIKRSLKKDTNGESIHMNDLFTKHDGHLQKDITSYKCQECSKCFKDPDVFVLHNRTHARNAELQERLSDRQEKENLSTNSDFAKQETLRANPILANLLKSSISNDTESCVYDTNNILSIENQIMGALTANMESYIRNLSSMLSSQKERHSEDGQSSENGGHSDNSDEGINNFVRNSLARGPNLPNDSQNLDDDGQNVVDVRQDNVEDAGHLVKSQVSNDEVDMIVSFGDDNNLDENGQTLVDNPQNIEESGENLGEDDHNLVDDTLNLVDDGQNLVEVRHSSVESKGRTDEYNGILSFGSEPSCDNQDLNESKDSTNLVIDENV